MPRPSKGDRKLYGVRVPKTVDLEEAAKAAGYETISQFIADTMLERVGRLDLIEGPSRPVG